MVSILCKSSLSSTHSSPCIFRPLHYIDDKQFSRKRNTPFGNQGNNYWPELKLKRREFLRGVGSSAICMTTTMVNDEPVQALERLPFKPEGYNFWTWRGFKIHYVVQGEGPPLLLIHGFGASSFHWRYNIPTLAKNFKVYAIDLLGFGWSEKAIIEYNPLVWRDQISDFLREVVKEPTIVVGNSIGGITSLLAATHCPEMVTGVALLNSAGQFRSPDEQPKSDEQVSLLQKITKPLRDLFQRIVIGFAFWQAKQPARIQSVLKNVYPNPTNVDDYLIESITFPTNDPNAGEVYYRLMTQFFLSPSKVTLNDLLEKLSCPLLLLWGDLDPWVGAGKADKIKDIYPNSSLVHLQAGHCPHDEVPELVNKALTNWVLPITSPLPLKSV